MKQPNFINAHTHTPNQTSDTTELVDISETYHTLTTQPSLYSIGNHPCLTPQNLPIQLLRNAAAIGECGLDTNSPTPINQQLTIFNQQLQLAAELNKPVIIHCIKNYSLLLQTIRQYPNLTILMHAYHGSIELARQILKTHNAYFSFGQRELNIKKCTATILQLPLNTILLETDCHQSHIRDTYFACCNLLSIPLETLKQQLNNNFTSFLTQTRQPALTPNSQFT